MAYSNRIGCLAAVSSAVRARLPRACSRSLASEGRQSVAGRREHCEHRTRDAWRAQQDDLGSIREQVLMRTAR